jgi:hypothetical protein
MTMFLNELVELMEMADVDPGDERLSHRCFATQKEKNFSHVDKVFLDCNFLVCKYAERSLMGQEDGSWFDVWRQQRPGKFNLARALYRHAIKVYRKRSSIHTAPVSEAVNTSQEAAADHLESQVHGPRPFKTVERNQAMINEAHDNIQLSAAKAASSSTSKSKGKSKAQIPKSSAEAEKADTLIVSNARA